jgi:hypothetical protein
VTVLLCAVAPAHAQTAMPPLGPTGILAAGPGSMVVWAEHANRFLLWRVEVVRGLRWTPLAVPAELTTALVASQDEADTDDLPMVHVTYANGGLHLFWAGALECPPARGSSYLCTQISAAASIDGGKRWSVSRSLVKGQAENSIVQAVLTPDGHGWMRIQGDPGAGQLPEILVVSSDSGKTWSLSPAEGMPIGRDRPQLTIVQSDAEGWAMAVDYDEDDPPLIVTHTIDGGESWVRNTSIGQDVPWCGGCHFTQLSRGDDSVHDGRTCFEAMLRPAEEGKAAYARFCLTAEGMNWRSPVRLAMPTALDGPDAGDGTAGGELPVFADGQPGFDLVWHQVAGESHNRFDIYQTGDGGKGWKISGVLAAAGYKPGDDVALKQIAAVGDAVAVLVARGERGAVLVWSMDRGATWVASR